MDSHQVAIVGMGARGTYAFERLTAELRAAPPDEPVVVHLVEPVQFGGGDVYSTAQPDYVLMNTLASQLTAYPDETVEGALREEGRLSFLEWCRDSGLALGERDYPPRALHGRYLRFVVEDCLQRLPDGVSVCFHRTRAVDIDTCPGGRILSLENGTKLTCRQVLLSMGNVAGVVGDLPSVDMRSLCGGTAYFETAYPLSRLEPIATDAVVGVLGLGLTSIDVIISLTVGRGGRFTGEPGHLKYEPSGREPTIVAWSRTGIPLLPRGKNQKGAFSRYEPRFLTRNAVDKLRVSLGKLDFEKDVFPLILRDMEFAYYQAQEGGEFAERLATVDEAGREALLNAAQHDGRFSWDAMVKPAALHCPSYEDADQYQEALFGFLEADLAEAKRGNVDSPVKAACDVLRDIRDEIRYAVEFGSLTSASLKSFRGDFEPPNNFLAVGPPAERIDQLMALSRAGVLDFAWGAEPVLERSENGRARLRSSRFRRAKQVELDVLVDGRVAHPASVLVHRLLLRQAARLASVADDTGRYELETIEVTHVGQVVRADGSPDDRIWASGHVAEGTVWYTQAAARPGVNSRTLRDASRWAQHVRDSLADEQEAMR